MSPGAPGAVARLAARYRLDAAAVRRLRTLMDLLVGDPHAPTAVREPARVADDHLADSLVALDLAAVTDARTLADLGSGAGLPGLPLAIALPTASVTLIESSIRKCAFLERAAIACELANVEVLHARAEEAGLRDQRYDVVTARALAAPGVVAEYAAPLLRVGGQLVMWRGARDEQAEVEAEKAAAQLGLEVVENRRVEPFSGALQRHLYLMSKVSDTPDRYPRRPGMALKRPLGRG